MLLPSRLLLTPLSILMFAFVFTPNVATADPSSLREKLDRSGDAAAKNAVEKALVEAIRDFYSKREYRSLWFDDSKPASRTTALLASFSKASDHGLNQATYGMPKLAEQVSKADRTSEADVELALTRAYLEYAGDVSSGVVDNPRRVGGIFRDAKRPAPGKLLDDIAAATDPAAFLDRLAPDARRYKALKEVLAKYRQIERNGGWPVVDKGPTLKPSMTGVRVAQVKRRLIITGDLTDLATAEQFDDALVAAVKKFQLRHGLKDDGNVGAETAAEMNVPVKDRIEQIVINLERRRWLGAHLGDRYIYVNIADNDLKVVEKDKTIHTARVVVGKPFHETPVFSGNMTYIDLNPYWNVPHGIATKELLPKIQRDPSYLTANDYLLLTRMGDNNSAINPHSVNWSTVTAQNFPYHLRQKPGAKNALGTMAFMFPNPHNVFMHDTSSRNLFSVEDRYFSHGCVRVEFPMKLALLLLAKQDGGPWNERRMKSVHDTNELTRVNLTNPIAVHITYLTAWADPDGTAQFRKDVYKRDGTLKKAIQQIALAK